MARSANNLLQLASDASARSQFLRAESRDLIQAAKLSTADMRKTVSHTRTLIHETLCELAAAGNA